MKDEDFHAFLQLLEGVKEGLLTINRRLNFKVTKKGKTQYGKGDH